MPTFSLSGPDGAEYEIDAPDEGAAFKAFQSLGPAQNAPAATATDAPAAGVAGDASAAVGRGLLNGVPVVGPALLGGAERLAAGIRSYQNNTPYADELQKVQNFSQGTAEAHPYATTAGEVGGGVVGTAPLIAAAPAAFGAGGGGLALRSAAAAGSGAVLGGADAAVRSGGDLGQIEAGAAAGGALGAVGPATGSLIGAGARRFYEMIGGLRAPDSGFGSAATRMLGEDTAASGGTQAVRDRLAQLGQPSMLLDASPSFQGRAQGLAARPETMQAIVDPIRTRAEGTTARLNADVEGALGPAASPRELDAQIKALRNVPNTAIGNAIRNAPNPVDIRPVLQSIDQRLQNAVGGEAAALQRARGLLAHTDPETGWVTIENNPQRLHGVKQELDNLINYGAPEIGIQPGSLQRQQNAVRDVRSQLNQHLRDQVPGYAQANDASAQFARQADAAEAGYNEVMRTGPDALFPQDLQAQLANMSPAERAAMARGNRADIGRRLGTNANDLAALSSALQGEGGFNTAKMGLLHGEEPTQRVVDAVARERAFADANRRIVEGSQTAQRTRAADAIAPRDSLGDDLGGTVAGVVGGPQGFALAQAARAGKALVNAAGREADVARNRDLARAVTLNQGEALDRLLNAIQARSVIAQRAAGVGALAGRGTQALTLSQGDRASPYLPSPSLLLR
jgi:hypothetical protein